MNALVSLPMADDRSYREALELRTSLADQLRVVNEYIAAYERLFLGSARDHASQSEAAGRSGRRQRNVIPPRQLADLAKRLIVEAGRPMTRSELAQAIEATGIPLVGRDKVKNLGTILWRHENEFVNVPGRGYWPKDAGEPPPIRD